MRSEAVADQRRVWGMGELSVMLTVGEELEEQAFALRFDVTQLSMRLRGQ